MKCQVIALALLLFAACGRKGGQEAPVAAAAPPPASSGAVAAVKPVPLDARAVDKKIVVTLEHDELLDTLTVGGPDLTERPLFHRGDAVVATVRLKQVPKGLAVRATIEDARGRERFTQQLPADPATRTVTFAARDTADWAAGPYTLRLYIGGNEATTREIRFE